MSRAFLGQGKHVFEKVVLIEYPRKGIYSLGFLTAEACAEIQEKTKSEIVYVFVPTTPNPTTGYLQLVPAERVHILDMATEEAMQLIMSAGLVAPAALCGAAQVSGMSADSCQVPDSADLSYTNGDTAKSQNGGFSDR